mmetsp:Transcript_27473/g.69923  ORF Transcript_27473/g.69923 Transcript_27473/m.69923 type:complete len:87 (+) Transcript_27473:467-727(+)
MKVLAGSPTNFPQAHHLLKIDQLALQSQKDRAEEERKGLLLRVADPGTLKGVNAQRKRSIGHMQHAANRTRLAPNTTEIGPRPIVC